MATIQDNIRSDILTTVAHMLTAQDLPTGTSLDADLWSGAQPTPDAAGNPGVLILVAEGNCTTPEGEASEMHDEWLLRFGISVLIAMPGAPENIADLGRALRWALVTALRTDRQRSGNAIDTRNFTHLHATDGRNNYMATVEFEVYFATAFNNPNAL